MRTKPMFLLTILCLLGLLGTFAWWRPSVLEAKTSQTRRVKHTTFKGPAAKGFLAEHARRHGREAALAKAGTALEQRGFTDAEEVTFYEAFTDITIEPTLIGRLVSAVAPVAHAQKYSRPEGYMTVWTWNDGDAATWEGMVEWIQFRPEGAVFAMAATQIDTTRGDSSAVLWTDGIDAGSNARGGATTCRFNYKGIDCRDYRGLPGTISQQAWIGFISAEFPILWGCRYSGAGYFPCVGWLSAGNLVWSGIRELTRYARDCQCLLFATNCPAGCGA